MALEIEVVTTFTFDEGIMLDPIEHGYSTAFAGVVMGILAGAGFSDRTFESRLKKDFFYVNYRKCWICLFHYDENNLAELRLQFVQPFMEHGCDWSKRELREEFVITSLTDVLKHKDRIVEAANDINECWRKYYREYHSRKKEEG